MKFEENNIPQLSYIILLAMDLIISISSALYLPMVSLKTHVGIGTLNNLIDSTKILLTLFLLLFFIFYCQIVKSNFYTKKKSIVLGLLLLLCKLIKPIFTITITISVVVIFRLINYRRYLIKLYLLSHLLIYLPLLLVILY